jgi:Asp-tRNA(Asn)/Glu-tRNA(Gln) amidotransferase A subunit family amidase
MKTIPDQSAREIVAGVAAGAFSARDVARAHLERIAADEPRVRAFAYLDEPQALAAAEQGVGPLRGLPVAVKDIIDTADMPTAWGAARLAARRSQRDATLVARLKAAGAFVIGKAVTSQYALFVPGPTTNPRDVARTPGGSSSGSAAAVAASFAPVALGTQTNGSVIRPASYCGIVGFKPSLGVLPRTGVLRHCAIVDHPGVFARDVEDAAFLVDALAGADADDSASYSLGGSLQAAARNETLPKLAWLVDTYAERAEPGTRASLDAFANGLGLERVKLAPEFADAEAIMRVLMSAGFAQSLGDEIDAEGEAAAELLRATLRYGRGLAATDFVAALEKRNRLLALAKAQLAPFDAVLTFASAGEAPLRAQGTGDPIFATLWSLIGAPAYSLPLLSGPNGLPIGVQLVAAPGADLRLTRAAAWLFRRFAS